MKMPLRRTRIFAFFCLMGVSFSFVIESPTFAQVSVNVSTLDSAYRDIDKLVANGLVDKIIVGQRPYSRKEIARITAEAMLHLPRLQDPLNDPNLSPGKKQKLQTRLDYVQEVLSRLQDDYREELVQMGALPGEKEWYSLHPIEKADLGIVMSNSLPRTVPSNGLGSADAVINPLLQYRQGRHIIDGSTLSLETTHWIRATDYFALMIHPRFQVGIGRDGQSNDSNAYVQNLYGKFYVKNFELEVGRDNLIFGQGLNSGLMLSNNPNGLDMAKISSDSPFLFPWVFKYLGENKMTFFYADLGADQNFPHPYLVGYKWSLQPVSFFEIGASLQVQSGGQGSPQASFGQRVGDIFPIAHFFFGSQDQIGNKLGGVDFRFRIPPARGMEFYLEAIFDDTHSQNSHAQFIDDAGYIGGLYFPRLNNAGQVDLRLEYHRTGLRYYEHSQFTSGMTLDKFFLGDDLGPNAQGAYLTSNWDVDSHNLLTFNAALESRSADIYALVSPTDSPEFFQKLQDFPEERRFRVTTEWLHRVQSLPVQLKTLVGYERVQNFNFSAGSDRNNFMG